MRLRQGATRRENKQHSTSLRRPKLGVHWDLSGIRARIAASLTNNGGGLDRATPGHVPEPSDHLSRVQNTIGVQRRLQCGHEAEGARALLQQELVAFS